MNPTTGIVLKVASTLLFIIMAACIKLAADRVPTGELVFARSFFALIPILAFTAWQGKLRSTMRTQRPGGHVWRGLVGTLSMICWFIGIALLPLPEALALSYAAPLITVVLSVALLGEIVRIYRWSAVAIGLLGVLIILWPRLSLIGGGAVSPAELWGTAAALTSAAAASFAMIQVRSLIASENTATIVIYFTLTASVIALLTLPFGWVVPTPIEAGLLLAAGLIGGVGQLLMTESYRHAEASTIATFDYTSMLWSLLIGWLVFGDIASWPVLAGMAVIIGSGLFIILRERQLGRIRPIPSVKP